MLPTFYFYRRCGGNRTCFISEVNLTRVRRRRKERKRKKMPWEKKTPGCTRLHPTRDVTSKNTWVTLPTCVPLPHTCWGGDIGRAGGRLV